MDKSNLAQIIRERRAVKKGYSDKEVKGELVLELLEDAAWAPTHGMREPWRFIFVGADRLPEFAKQVASTYPEERQQNREDYLNETSAIRDAVMEEADIPKQWYETYGASEALI